MILLPNINDDASIDSLLGGLLEKICTPFELQSGVAQVGASLGVSFYPEHGQTMDVLVSRADKAMYQVKKQGKNDWLVAT